VSPEVGVLIVLVKAQLQLAHPPAVPGERTSSGVHLDSIGALLANRGSAGLEYPAGAAAKAPQCSDVVLVLIGSHWAARSASEV
jgi:hypothetical protein